MSNNQEPSFFTGEKYDYAKHGQLDKTTTGITPDGTLIFLCTKDFTPDSTPDSTPDALNELLSLKSKTRKGVILALQLGLTLFQNMGNNTDPASEAGYNVEIIDNSRLTKLGVTEEELTPSS